ncbi:MAG: ABC transporter permease [Candidatus Marinimicrobia bacterium]|nr:ABC transporter permease [Candidatus Neomarinimicrobiota bacterium]MCF7851217.1 ABC transporter permease [Candidatus Neomarinimicrobiota bacterium]MCF7905210.1 ABC transporter permease [Candidatus Neomarinimicrobiota bacterium]
MSKLNWFIALRYFFTTQRNRFISWVGGISIIGIAIGVIALIVSMAVLNGFEGEVTRRITSFIPHVTLKGDVSVEDCEPELTEVRSIFRSLERKALLEVSDEQRVLNVRAVGQDQWTFLLKESSYYESQAGRLSRDGDELPGIVIGVGVADDLYLKEGDTVVVKSPLDIRQGLLRVPQRHFVVTGIFQSEIFDFDRNLAIIGYREGRRLFKSAGESAIHIQFDDYESAPRQAAKLESAFPEAEIKTWYDQHKTLFDAMQMEKWGSFIGLNLIILVAVFNIVSTLMMMVLEKTGSIGILRVMGASSRSIRQIFNLQGLMVAITGVVFGTVIGVLLVLGQEKWAWIKLPEDIYLIPVLPVEMYVHEVIVVGVVAFIIVLFSIRYPAKKAAGLVPLDAINYKR